MKISALKFGLGLGIALSISFLLCNIIFAIGGKDFSLSIINTLFHNMDFTPLMYDATLSVSKMLCGMFILFLEGMFTGYLTAAVYNALTKKQTT